MLAPFNPKASVFGVHDRMSPLPQPSLLVNMLNLNGTASSRLVANRIFCTDCHNSDENRGFGGTGGNGAHGSSYAHILERNYQMSQASFPGGGRHRTSVRRGRTPCAGSAIT